MQKDQEIPGQVTDALHNPNQQAAEKYVKERKDKAKEQIDAAHKMDGKSLWDWGSIKYVIL
jgi:hypothetical protein